MIAELSHVNVEQLLKGFSIPPRPALLVEINEILKQENPSLQRIAARGLRSHSSSS